MYLLLTFQRNSEPSTSSPTSVQSPDGRQVHVHITIKCDNNQFLIIKIVSNNNMETIFWYESSWENASQSMVSQLGKTLESKEITSSGIHVEVSTDLLLKIDL